MDGQVVTRRIDLADLRWALVQGYGSFRQSMGVSLGYAGLFTLIGALLFGLLEHWQLAPLSISLAGGFMLFGPILLAGFFAVVQALDAGENPGVGHILAGYRRAPSGLWMLSLFCMLLFMIWITDAAIVYAVVIGQQPLGFGQLFIPEQHIGRFLFFSALMGLALASILFAVTAFSLPLLIYRKVGLVAAVVASVRAVFGSFLTSMTWAMVLVLLVMTSAWLLPLLPFTLPICAYAGYHLFERSFPAEEG